MLSKIFTSSNLQYCLDEAKHWMNDSDEAITVRKQVIRVTSEYDTMEEHPNPVLNYAVSIYYTMGPPKPEEVSVRNTMDVFKLCFPGRKYGGAKGVQYEELTDKIKEFCERMNYHYYSAEKQHFSLDTAKAEAVQRHKIGVVVENLS